MKLPKLLILTVTIVLMVMVAGTAEAKAQSCTFKELETLQIEIGFQGWVEWNLKTQSAAGYYVEKACSKVPAKWRVLNRDFTASTKFVDRLYPGMYHGSWAWNCASSEGGHGLFVMNRGGSGAGGWLQFMSGTFWSVIYNAVDRARRYGVRVPDFALTWTSPLGQALAGSEMLFHGRRGEWSGATC